MQGKIASIYERRGKEAEQFLMTQTPLPPLRAAAAISPALSTRR